MDLVRRIRTSWLSCGIFLMIGGLLAVPFLTMVFWTGQVAANSRGSWLPTALAALLTSLPVLVPALLPATRVLERTALRELLGLELPEPEGKAAAWDVVRGGLWYVFHLLSGTWLIVALVIGIPSLATVAVTAVTGDLRTVDGVADSLFGAGTGGAALLGGAAAAQLALLVPIGQLIRPAARALLGPSQQDLRRRAEREAERLARRNELARELHDSVGHALTVTTLQASAARLLVTSSPERAAEAMRAVEEAGRNAMAELDYVLGVLREDSRPTAKPVPTLADVAQLVAEAAAGGIQMELSLDPGLAAGVPPSLSREAYRMLQEGLTNVLKHGTGTAAALRIGRQADSLVMVLRNPARTAPGTYDDGGSAGGATVTGGKHLGGRDIGGRGLAGIRERAGLLHGTVAAGPQDGCWELRIDLPLKGRPL
jgi:signal transduction histidine kinase